MVKCYLFLEGEKWDSLRDWVSRGWGGISHSVPFRTDVILSCPLPGLPSLAAKESMCSPPRSRPLDSRKVCSVPFSGQKRGPPDLTERFATGRRQSVEDGGHYHIDESRSCLSLSFNRQQKVCWANSKHDNSWALDPAWQPVLIPNQ